MRPLGLSLALIWFASGIAWAGVGAWTASPGSFDSAVVVVPDGTLYQGCGEFACRSVDHGNTWERLAGPPIVFGYPYTNVLAVDAAGAIYAAVVTGGEGQTVSFVSVSRDGGDTWTSLLPEMFSTNDVHLSLDPFSSSTLVLLTGFVGGPHSVPVSGRLSRSTDGGVQWNEIDQALIGPIGTGSVTAFAFDPQTRGRLYAATAVVDFPSGIVSGAGLFASGDGGSTWTRSTATLPGALVTLIVDPFHPSTLYGGAASGIFRSDDAGQTFVSKSPVSTRQIVADALHAGRLYAATASGVLSSADGGASLTAINTGLTNLDVDYLALDATRGYLYASTTAGVFAYRIPDPGALVLDAAHSFTITLSATDQRTGRTGPGVATPVNDLWGYFSIPAITGNPNNPEVFVKMLDGTALNGSFWFFYGGLTDVEYTLTVTEDATGLQRTYSKPAGSECGGSDTAAFAP